MDEENKLNLCDRGRGTVYGEDDDSGDADRDGNELESKKRTGTALCPRGESTNAQWLVGQGDRGRGLRVRLKRNLKDKKKSTSACNATKPSVPAPKSISLSPSGWMLFSSSLLWANHQLCNLRCKIPVSDSITVDLEVDDLVEDCGDSFFGGPEPRQIQTEKKSVALPLSGKAEPKEGGVSSCV